MKKDKVVFVPVYIDKWVGLTDTLPEAERNRLIGAYLDYAVFHKEPKGLSKISKMLFQFLKPAADDLYGNKGGAPEGNKNAKKKTTEKQPVVLKTEQPVETTEKQPVETTEKQPVETTKNNLLLLKAKSQKLNKERERQRERGTPTLDEVVEFARQNRLSINPARFYKYYQARGWKVNGELVHDWKALMESWTESTQPEQVGHDETEPLHPEVLTKCPVPECGSHRVEQNGLYGRCNDCGIGLIWQQQTHSWEVDA